MRQDIIPHSRVARAQVRSIPRSVHAARRVMGDIYVRRTRVTDEYVEVTETYIAEPAPMTRPIEHLSPEDKVEVLQRALARAQVELKAEHRSRRGLRKLTLTKVL
ncbi:MAG: hypothetical protein WAV04_00905 [Candidatus Microsaccharimonas sp.]